MLYKKVNRLILCIDTITEFAGITLVDSKKCYAYLLMKKEKIAETILQTIDKALKRTKICLRPLVHVRRSGGGKRGGWTADLTGVLVIKGPGSFTGLRIGIAVANQFAHQLKIPIVGLRTDEWCKYRTDEKSAMYLQSMNHEEMYTIKGIVPISSLRGPAKYFGELSDEHRAKLPPAFQEIKKFKSVQQTWIAAALDGADKFSAHKTYDLIEPFYGKEPTITKPKKNTAEKD